MKELEDLLTSLVQRGRKPWGIIAEGIRFITTKRFSIHFYEKRIGMETLRNLRELVSLESGLWQFCVENKMVNWWIWIGRNKRIKTKEGEKSMQRHWKNKHQYRLLESALIPEEELGKFLVENIKVEWNQISNAETK